MNNNLIVSTLVQEGIRIGSTYIKGNIRNSFYHKRKEVPLEYRVSDLKKRVIDLEIGYADSNFTEEVDNLKFETFNDAIERGNKLPTREWAVPGIIPTGSVCNVQATEKSGKSLLMTQIGHDCAYALSSSLVPESGGKVSQQEVFLYDAELDDDDMRERYHDFNDGRMHRCPSAWFESAAACMRHIENNVSDVEGNVLVIVDNVTAVCTNFSSNDIKILRKRIRELQNNFLDRGYRLTIIFVHHTKTGSHGSDKQDIAGSINWTRLGKLNLALSDTRYGDKFKMLSVASGRNDTKILHSDEALLLELVGEPYPHFKFSKVCKIEEAMPKKKPKQQGTDDSGEVQCGTVQNSTDYLNLSETEKEYILGHYIQGEYGLGRLATDIFEMRGYGATNRQKGSMKNKIYRFVESMGLKK